jgi:hypothetical protein
MRLALYVYLKNSCDGVGGQDESNGTPLDPPLFWLDNIFKSTTKDLINLTGLLMFYSKSCNKKTDYEMPPRDIS